MDRYDEAARLVFGKPAAQIPWTRKIERPGVMELIEVGSVTDKLDALMARPAANESGPAAFGAGRK